MLSETLKFRFFLKIKSMMIPGRNSVTNVNTRSNMSFL